MKPVHVETPWVDLRTPGSTVVIDPVPTDTDPGPTDPVPTDPVRTTTGTTATATTVRPTTADRTAVAPRGRGVRHRASRVLLGAAAVTAGCTVLVATGATHWLDQAAALPLHEQHTWIDRVGKVTELPGQRAIGYPLALAALAWLSRSRRDVRPVLTGLLAMLLVNLVVGAAKLGLARPSPRRDGTGDLAVGWDGSLGGYPSGHAANVAALAVVLLLLVLPGASRRGRLLLGGGTLAVVLVVCATSWLRATHWVTDLVAGAGVGAVCAAGAVLAVGLLTRSGSPAHPALGSILARWRRPRSATASG